MNAFSHFLDVNLNQRVPAAESEKYQDGVAGVVFLEETDPLAFDCVTLARFLYIRNLSLRTPVRFEVPEGLGPAERALMLLSYNDFEGALDALHLGLECEVIGAELVGRTGAVQDVLVLKLTNTLSSEMYDFVHELSSFKDFRVEPLSHLELVFLYIKAKELHASDDNRALAKLRLAAFINRALFEKNELNDALKKAFLLLRTEISNDVRELEGCIGRPVGVDAGVFSSPIVFRSAVEIQVGRSLMACYDYGAAYDILRDYPLFDEKIDCLIGMKRPETAVFEIERQIDVLLGRGDQIALSGLYTKLGHLRQDVRYFDMAAAVYRSARPHQLKGLWLFNRKLFPEAADAFEQALKITPNNEEIRFSYGCALVQLDRIGEALKVFRALRSENPQNENIAKNLSYCYHRLEDVDGMLSTLRSVAMHDHTSMRQYLYVSIKNDRLENVRWGLQRMNYDDTVWDMVNYLLRCNKMDEAELRGILESNSFFSADQVRSIFGR